MEAVPEGAMRDELEMLDAVYGPDALSFTPERGGWRVVLRLTPNTGEAEGADFVRLTLHALLLPGYPAEDGGELGAETSAAQFELHDTRGLSDATLSTIRTAVLAEAVEATACGGCAVLQAAQVAQDELTAANAQVECSICLQRIEGADCEGQTVRTPCFHTFHTACLARWWTRAERQEEDYAAKSAEGAAAGVSAGLELRDAERAAAEKSGALRDLEAKLHRTLTAQRALEAEASSLLPLLPEAEQRRAKDGDGGSSCGGRSAALQALDAIGGRLGVAGAAGGLLACGAGAPLHVRQEEEARHARSLRTELHVRAKAAAAAAKALREAVAPKAKRQHAEAQARLKRVRAARAKSSANAARSIGCPVCRARVAYGDVAAKIGAEQLARRDGEKEQVDGGSGGSGGRRGATHSSTATTAAAAAEAAAAAQEWDSCTRRYVETTQQAIARGLARQRQKGALVAADREGAVGRAASLVAAAPVAPIAPVPPATPATLAAPTAPTAPVQGRPPCVTVSSSVGENSEELARLRREVAAKKQRAAELRAKLAVSKATTAASGGGSAAAAAGSGGVPVSAAAAAVAAVGSKGKGRSRGKSGNKGKSGGGTAKAKAKARKDT